MSAIICGNCFAPKSEHYKADKLYCFKHTDGDLFTDEPDENLILSILMERHADEYDQIVADWKRDNGHTQ